MHESTGKIVELMNLLVVFGTRPEAIKLAPLILKLRQQFKVKICVTGQHREMLDQVLSVFKINSDFDLNLMKPNQNLTSLTSGVLEGVQGVLEKEHVDWIIVQGDTTTSMAAAIAAFYKKINIAHVEAGLRTSEKFSPFPEEINRQLTSRLADIHFAPTEKNRDSLIQENIPPEKIFVTGNTVIDALQWVLKNIPEPVWDLPFHPSDKRMILVTGHRRENFGEGFQNICKAIKTLALKNPNVEFVYPVHLNPNVQKPVTTLLANQGNIHLIEPLDYQKFVHFMNRSYFILTDSGGVQEEAPSIGKPVLVMRDTTERPEAVEAGTVMLVGTDENDIVKNSQKLIDNNTHYKSMSFSHNPYGDGTASEKITNVFQKSLI
mgnify:FL=1